MPDAESNQPADHAGVFVHPPLIYLGGLMVSSVLQWMVPLRMFSTPAPRAAGLVLALAGLSVIAAGQRLMKAHGTNIQPTRPTTVIIQSGPYRFSRNPLYLALTIAYSGFALLINTGWAFILLPLVLLAMHFLVVLREERYLERKFGEVYRGYRRKVRRYL